MTLYDSEREEEDDPMVSVSVNHFEVRVDIGASRSGARGLVSDLIDSGNT